MSGFRPPGPGARFCPENGFQHRARRLREREQAVTLRLSPGYGRCFNHRSVGGTFLLRDEREFAEVVILERALGIGRLIQIKCPRDMDFKRAGFDKAV